MKNFINIADIDKKDLREIIDNAKLQKSKRSSLNKSATDPDTIDQIIGDLKERKFLVYVEQYPHVYPHCWRSGDELVFRLVDEWYINMDWRDEIKKVVNEIKWIPGWGQEREHE